jgi:hypothetical protein
VDKNELYEWHQKTCADQLAWHIKLILRALRQVPL